MNSENLTVFITGINRGLGRHLAEQVLEGGGRVAGTARDLTQLQELQALHGERLWLRALELTNVAGIQDAVAAAFGAFPRIDAVISNAGYSLLGAAEECSEADIRQLLDTNLLGSIHLARAAVPYLRAQGGGRLVQISSSASHTGFPGLSLYCASKWAIEGFFEALAPEVAPFGIETCLVEPGAIRTDFGASGVFSPPLDVYRGTPAHQFREMGHFEAPGDPSKMARAILASLRQSPAPTRLALGSDAYQMIRHALVSRLGELDRQRETSFSTDFQPMPVA
jgi:NAD(P)-dependent dehydrogenase (short-subunit alcohol dehydrogenase family)